MPPRHQRDLSRRKLITALAGAAVAVPVAAVIAPHALATKDPAKGNSKAAGALPLTIVNNSGSFANTSVRVYVVGNQDGRQVRLTPEGTLAPISLSDNGADGFTDYSIPLSGSGETTLSLPYMSGRIYVALGDKLKIKAVADGNGNAALQYPMRLGHLGPQLHRAARLRRVHSQRRSACSATPPWSTCSASP